MKLHGRCPLCGGHDLPPAPAAGRRQRELEPVLCTGCGLIMLQRDPFAGEREQADARCLHCPTGAHVDHVVPRSFVNAQRHLTALGALLRPGLTMLDVGCGEGALLAGAVSRGVRATGIDISERNCAVARDLSGATVICSAFEDAAFGEQYDLITCNHALEHAPDPLDWLRRMRRLLKPDGVLFVEVPNTLRPHVSIRRVYQPQHLFYFTPKTLRLALEVAGFAPWLARVYAHEDVAILSQPGEPRVAPDPDHAAKVIAGLRRHAWRYYLTLMFVWRKIKPIRNLVFYHQWTDIPIETAAAELADRIETA